MAAAQPLVSPCRGMAVVVTCMDRPELLPGCLASISRQTQSAAKVIVAGGTLSREAAVQSEVEFLEAPSAAAARELGLQRVLQSTPMVRGVVFLNEGVRLDPEHLSVSESVLERQPGVGLVTSFLQYESPRENLNETPIPGSPWTSDDLDHMPCMALRAGALQSREAAGTVWASVRYPGILASVISTRDSSAMAGAKRKKRYSAMSLAQHGSMRFTLHWFLAAPWNEKARWVGRVITRPRRTVHWLAWHLRAAAARAR
jgi:hypothetical protein